MDKPQITMQALKELKEAWNELLMNVAKELKVDVFLEWLERKL